MLSNATLEMYSIEYTSTERDGDDYDDDDDHDDIDDEGDKDDDRDDNCPAVMMIIMQPCSNPHDNHVHASFAFQFSS